LSVSLPEVLPAAAGEHAWRLLWQRLLQPIPDDTEGEPEPRKPDRPDDELAAEDSEAA
jgi:hypothetical protein